MSVTSHLDTIKTIQKIIFHNNTHKKKTKKLESIRENKEERTDLLSYPIS